MNERQKYINDLSIYLRQLADEERNDALEFYDAVCKIKLEK